MLQHCVVLRLIAGVDETMGEAGFLMCSLSIQGEGGGLRRVGGQETGR